MATVIDQALKGRKKAMEQLYAANKQKVYYISKLLTGSETEAAEATAFAFKNIWSTLLASSVKTEKVFTYFAIDKAVEYCKRSVTKRNPKAFFAPQNPKIAEEKTADEDVGSVLKALPPIHRYTLVLGQVGAYRPERLTKIFNLDLDTVNLLLDSEEDNISTLLRSGDADYAWLVDELKNGEAQVEVPASVDAAVTAVIAKLSAPAEKRAKTQNLIILITAAAILLTVGIVLLLTLGKEDESAGNGGYTNNSGNNIPTVITEPVIELDDDLVYYADIEIEHYGIVTVRLNQQAAPVTVANFVDLARKGFYNGLKFHRIIEDFMMQGGDPYGDGTGGVTDAKGNDVNIVGEFSNNGYNNTLSHTRGAISMARANDPDSASSQFFIVHQDSPHLDGDYAVFGYVVSGMEVVDDICVTAEPLDDNGTIESYMMPKISSITIRTEPVSGAATDATTAATDATTGATDTTDATNAITAE